MDLSPVRQLRGFRLETLDGSRVSLADLRGRPVVLEFGSYTCPIFCGHVETMETLSKRYPEAVFLVIYTREAHPGEVTAEHRSLADKRAAARRLVDEEPISRTVLIDDLKGTIHRTYGAAWDAVYVIDRDGQVVLRQAWTHPEDVAAVLDALAADRTVLPREATEMASPSGRPMGEGLLRGGKQALFDFYRTAPPPLTSSSPERSAPTELGN